MSNTHCPLDGNVRRIVDQDRYSITYRCGWCMTVSREECDPTPEGDLQREWGDTA